MGQPIVVPYIAIFEEINGKKMEPVEGGLVGISLCMSITVSIISHTNNLEIEIMAGQRTMSKLIVDLTGQTFVLQVMLTGQNSIVLKMK